MKPYYQDSSVTIYHGDCREIIPKLGKFSAVISDPPFSENTHSKAKTTHQFSVNNKAINFASINVYDLAMILSSLGAASDGWVIASLDWKHLSKFDEIPPPGLRLMRFGVWVKPNPTPQLSGDRPAQGWEAIGYFHRSDIKPKWFGGGAHGNFYLPLIRTENHPTQKPLKMLHTLVERFTLPGDSVLDPFAGSGTTGAACKDKGRKCVMIELDEKYCEMAAKRMGQQVLKLEENNNSKLNPE